MPDAGDHRMILEPTLPAWLLVLDLAFLPLDYRALACRGHRSTFPLPLVSTWMTSGRRWFSSKQSLSSTHLN